ncbi:polyphosphate polymerase domain-containing protein [bacterium]|nr:polyphosphate polymerase domain-containing protein [bacterium]
MVGDKLFTSRFEIKYLISAFQAEEIRRVLSFHMTMDPYCELCPGFSYLNTSLYFDSPDHHCYKSTAMGQKNRFKVRLRWYDDEPDTPIFLEEKRRTTDAISKLRAKLDRPALAQLMGSQIVAPAHVLSTSSRAQARLRLLLDTMQSLNLQPACHVRYMREAWAGPEHEYLRVTFDTQVQGHVVTGNDFARRESPGWKNIGEQRTILEIKFESTIPPWLQSLVHDFGLHRQSVPKYLLCMDTIHGVGHGVRQFAMTPGGIR